MSHDYPVMLKLAGRNCLVVGGGAVAERKVASLLEARADVTVVAEEWTPVIEGLVKEGRVRGEKRAFRETDVKGSFLVFAATNRPEVNENVCRLASSFGALVNRADRPEDSSFTDPAVLRRGKITFAVSTGGASPSLAKDIKRELEQLYGIEFEQAAEFLGEIRDLVQKSGLPSEKRHRLLREIWNEIGMKGIRSGSPEEWKLVVRRLLRIEEER
ncbi:precorrin-2 dehydrogenase/sirohydrochlorin ferrochelatase family protein [Paenibacillus gansuensis]|uniref:precorrin-2 dehydrogenase n=1 Tax=Paenibacillus gansuensis TaxID=306542 RepID=A0ABW5PB78_9BACL